MLCEDDLIENEVEKWCDALKIAIIEKNETLAFELTQNIPDFQMLDANKRIEYLMVARDLIEQSIEMLIQSKYETLEIMQRVKQAKKFLS